MHIYLEILHVNEPVITYRFIFVYLSDIVISNFKVRNELCVTLSFFLTSWSSLYILETIYYLKLIF